MPVCMYLCVCVCVCVRACMHICVCVCEWGEGGMLDEKFVFVKLWILVLVVKLDYQMYMPRAHLRKGALRPRYYYYVIIAFCFEC